MGSEALARAADDIVSCLAVKELTDRLDWVWISNLETRLLNLQAWAQLSILFHRGWFERLWIIQELNVCKVPVALWGRVAIPWTRLSNFADWILNPPSVMPNNLQRILPWMGAHRLSQVMLPGFEVGVGKSRGVNNTLVILQNT